MLYWCKWVEVDTEVLFHKSFPPEKFFIQYFSAFDVLAVRFALHTYMLAIIILPSAVRYRC